MKIPYDWIILKLRSDLTGEGKKTMLNLKSANCFLFQNSVYDLETNMALLRNYEKEINDTVFEWFTLIPEFVAEQLTYVGDPTDLIKLRAFRKRLREKLVEFERRSMEVFAEHNPAENEEFSRVNRQMKTLSKIVQSVKKHMSPEKRVAARATTELSSFTKASSVRAIEEDALQSDNDEDLLAPSSRTGTANFFLDREDVESLPSTQETNKLYASWNHKTEKRKRSPSTSFEPGPSTSRSDMNLTTSTTNQLSSASSASSKFKFKKFSYGLKDDDADTNTAVSRNTSRVDVKASFSEFDESAIADFIDSEVIREFENADDDSFTNVVISSTASSTTNVGRSSCPSWNCKIFTLIYFTCTTTR